MAKKNPLKMFGSWIGFIIGLFIPLPIIYAYIPSWKIILVGMIGIFESYGFLIFLYGLITPIAGFFLGWGIQTIFKRRRR